MWKSIISEILMKALADSPILPSLAMVTCHVLPWLSTILKISHDGQIRLTIGFMSLSRRYKSQRLLTCSLTDFRSKLEPVISKLHLDQLFKPKAVKFVKQCDKVVLAPLYISDLLRPSESLLDPQNNCFHFRWSVRPLTLFRQNSRFTCVHRTGCS